ncbi:MAG: SMC-Scp complex subunit ScpB [Candidatus Pacebacteria bacterium]|nr:SMC-Scp complex subunit ScpB [Candidatus Paceibacterota bacterium]
MLEKIITILYLSADPISVSKLAELLPQGEEEITASLPSVKEKLETVGLTLLVAGKDVSIATMPEFSTLIEAFRKDELKGDLTPSTLQVLTLVAYLGNITREQISYIRGVQSSQSIRTLSVRGLITRSGEMCSLTTEALLKLGVTKKEELPEYERISSEFLKKLSAKEE